MTTVLSSGAPADGFTSIVTLLDALTKPDKVMEAIEKIRAETAKQAEVCAEAKKLIDQAEVTRAELLEREQRLKFREEQVSMKESDLLDQTEKLKARARGVETLEAELEARMGEVETSQNARAKAIAAREEQLQADTARLSEQFAAREKAVKDAEISTAKDRAEAERLKALWQGRIDSLRQQVELAQQV